MKACSIIGLLFAAAILATVPVSPQVTSSGVELSVDQAQGQTYRRARVTARRVGRRSYRYARRAYRRGYGVAPSYYGASSLTVTGTPPLTVTGIALTVTPPSVSVLVSAGGTGEVIDSERLSRRLVGQASRASCEFCDQACSC